MYIKFTCGQNHAARVAERDSITIVLEGGRELLLTDPGNGSLKIFATGDADSISISPKSSNLIEIW